MTARELTATDRLYTYIARTFDAPKLMPESFVKELSATAMPSWRSLHAAGVLASVEMFRKVGDIDLQTSTQPVRDWGYFLLLELTEGIGVDEVLKAELDGGVEAALDAAASIEYLSSEVLVRPAHAGTAIPLPSMHFSAPPLNQYAGIEYIQIPERHWDEYRRFMHDLMGPVGAQLVKLGHSYQVQILERERVLRWSDTLPPWNRIHILWGEFDDPRNGFMRHTSEVIRSQLGAEHDVLSTLALANHYRVKPRMSKNVRVEALCLDRVRTAGVLPAAVSDTGR